MHERNILDGVRLLLGIDPERLVVSEQAIYCGKPSETTEADEEQLLLMGWSIDKEYDVWRWRLGDRSGT